LCAFVESLEEALFEKQINDACGGFELLARYVNDEHSAIEEIIDVGLVLLGGAEGVFEFGIREARERGLDGAVDSAALLIGVGRGDSGFVVECALEASHVECCLHLAVGGLDLKVEQCIVGRGEGALAEVVIKDKSIQPAQRVVVGDMVEDAECVLTADDGE
jgi:hypothetical protein